MKQKKKKTSKKKEYEKEYELHPFIKNELSDIIKSHIDDILEICSEEETDMSKNNWNMLNDIIIDVYDKYNEVSEKYGNEINAVIKKSDGIRKRTTYTITNNVRETQRKHFINDLYKHMKEDSKCEDYYIYLIYMHICCLIDENSKD